MSKTEFTVSVPTDEGFLGRECNGLERRRYFKVQLIACDRICTALIAVGASQRLSAHKGAAKHLEEAGREQALEYAHDEINKAFSKFAKEFEEMWHSG